MVASQHSRLGRTMDFNKAGIPKFGIGDPLGENFVAWSRGMHFPRDSRYGAFAGNVEVEDGQQRYKVRADQNYTVGEAAFVEIQEVYASVLKPNDVWLMDGHTAARAARAPQ